MPFECHLVWFAILFANVRQYAECSIADRIDNSQTILSVWISSESNCAPVKIRHLVWKKEKHKTFTCLYVYRKFKGTVSRVFHTRFLIKLFLLVQIDRPRNNYNFFRIFKELPYSLLFQCFANVIDNDKAGDTSEKFLNGVVDTGKWWFYCYWVLFCCQRHRQEILHRCQQHRQRKPYRCQRHLFCRWHRLAVSMSVTEPSRYWNIWLRTYLIMKLPDTKPIDTKSIW